MVSKSLADRIESMIVMKEASTSGGTRHRDMVSGLYIGLVIWRVIQDMFEADVVAKLKVLARQSGVESEGFNPLVCCGEIRRSSLP